MHHNVVLVDDLPCAARCWARMEGRLAQAVGRGGAGRDDQFQQHGRRLAGLEIAQIDRVRVSRDLGDRRADAMRAAEGDVGR